MAYSSYGQLSRYFLLALEICILCSFLQVAFSGETDYLLAGTKKIYLQNKEEQSRLISFLSAELSQDGYVVVGEIPDADAVLVGSSEIEITLDDRPLYERTRQNSDTYKYKYALISRDDEELWKTSVTIKGGQGVQEADKKASARIIEKLDKAIKSAKRKHKAKK
jgi:hypothetical protein